jgi:hypothetical protein
MSEHDNGVKQLHFKDFLFTASASLTEHGMFSTEQTIIFSTYNKEMLPHRSCKVTSCDTAT